MNVISFRVKKNISRRSTASEKIIFFKTTKIKLIPSRQRVRFLLIGKPTATNSYSHKGSVVIFLSNLIVSLV